MIGTRAVRRQHPGSATGEHIMTRTSRALCALALYAGFAGAAPAQAVFGDGFESTGQTADSDAQASRFLQQATFGATEPAIAALRGQRFEDWIAAQQALPPTLLLPYMRTEAGVQAPLDFHFLTEAWFDRALKAPDQLRQRV